MSNVYDLHLRSTSLSRPRRASGEPRRVSGSHLAAPSESAWASQDGPSKAVVSESRHDTRSA
jgi:hypothetical protein